MREKVGERGVAFCRRVGIEHNLQHAQKPVVFDDEEGSVRHVAAHAG
jgi:hypothetical protein